MTARPTATSTWAQALRCSSPRRTRRSCVEIAAAECGVAAWHAGTVEEGAKQVVIEPLRLAYAGDDLHVRA